MATDIEIPGGEETDLALALHKLANKPRGAMVTRVATLTAQNYNVAGGVALPWDDEVYDTDGCHDTTNNTRLTVPSGWTLARFAAMVRVENASGTILHEMSLRKNGSDTTFAGNTYVNARTVFSNPNINFRTGIISVSSGDYFELMYHVGDSSTDLVSYSWFEMELLA